MNRPVSRARFLDTIATYAEGVHRLGPPGPAAQVAHLPNDLAAFLRRFDGAELFLDAYSIFPAQRINAEGELWFFGETGIGERLALDTSECGRAPVVSVDESSDVFVEGSSFMCWITAVVLADGVIYDREGEFREGAFDESGEPSPRTIIKRERRYLKEDPDAPAPLWRLARALAQDGQRQEAAKVFRRIVKLGPQSCVLFDWGRLQVEMNDLDGGLKTLARAAQEEPRRPRAAVFATHAARVAVRAGNEPERARLTKLALALDPTVGANLKLSIKDRVEAGAVDEAMELLCRAEALAPLDLELLELSRRFARRQR